jgi:hypothetical protein
MPKRVVLNRSNQPTGWVPTYRSLEGEDLRNGTDWWQTLGDRLCGMAGQSEKRSP